MRIGIRERESELVNKIYAREGLGGKQESEAEETGGGGRRGCGRERRERG